MENQHLRVYFKHSDPDCGFSKAKTWLAFSQLYWTLPFLAYIFTICCVQILWAEILWIITCTLNRLTVRFFLDIDYKEFSEYAFWDIKRHDLSIYVNVYKKWSPYSSATAPSRSLHTSLATRVEVALPGNVWFLFFLGFTPCTWCSPAEEARGSVPIKPIKVILVVLWYYQFPPAIRNSTETLAHNVSHCQCQL